MTEGVVRSRQVSESENDRMPGHMILMITSSNSFPYSADYLLGLQNVSPALDLFCFLFILPFTHSSPVSALSSLFYCLVFVYIIANYGLGQTTSISVSLNCGSRCYYPQVIVSEIMPAFLKHSKSLTSFHWVSFSMRSYVQALQELWQPREGGSGNAL